MKNTVNQFVPNYVVKSDYLPTRVIDGNESQTNQLVNIRLTKIRQYEEEKRRGRVFTQRPAEFNPQRYASYRVYETVRVDQPLNEEHFSRVARR